MSKSSTSVQIIYSQLYQKDLKLLAKKYRLPISGTKKVLTERIEKFLNINKSIIIIQKVVRAFFSRQFYKMISTSKTKKKYCVNETDFYTLEPLINIPFYSLFVFSDEHNFTYGFNIESLIQLYIKTGKIVNPYNRNKISINVIFDIFTMYGLMRILYKNESPQCLRLQNNSSFRVMNANDEYTNSREYDNEILQGRNGIIIISTMNIDYSDYENDNVIMQLLTLQQRTNTNLLIMKETLQNIRNKICRIRQKPINNRIIEIFMEIDQLGHYTNSGWLFALNNTGLRCFITSLHEIWNYRAGIIDRVKYRISPFGDPFENIEFNNDTDRTELLTYCATIVENFILSAPDIDDRKLSTLFVLSALTRASFSARQQLFWLYESFEWENTD